MTTAGDSDNSFWTKFAIAAAALAACVALTLVCGGCKSSDTGVEVRASAASAIDIGDIKWDEYKIPIVSIVSGPRTKIFVNREYVALRKVSAHGSITNSVNALGIITSSEEKNTGVEMEFDVAATNPVKVVVRQ